METTRDGQETFRRRNVLGWGAGAALAAMTGPRRALAEEPVRIGVLTDMSGPFADYSGPTSVVAAQMAAAEVGQVLGRPVEIISADHQNKPDLGSSIAREWFDRRGVVAIADLGSSAVALAVQKLASDRGKVTLNTGPATGALMNEGCSRTGFMWVHDTYANTAGPSRMLMQQGLTNWYLIVSDYAYGHQMQQDLTRSIVSAGGKILGAARHPINAADFSSFLLQAQASNAQVVGVLNAGSDLINSVKQAAEFGLTQTQKFFLPGAVISDVHSLGLAQAQGLLLLNAFYSERDDESRVWSKEFFAKTKRMPGHIQAGTYSAVRHYLRCCQVAGSVEGTIVAEAMRQTVVNDMFVRDGRIRADGRLVHDAYIIQVKTPAESRAAWDYYKPVSTVRGDESMQPLAESRCPYLVK